MNDHFWHLENGAAYPQILKLYEYKNNSSEELWQEANESCHVAPQQPCLNGTFDYGPALGRTRYNSVCA